MQFAAIAARAFATSVLSGSVVGSHPAWPGAGPSPTARTRASAPRTNGRTRDVTMGPPFCCPEATCLAAVSSILNYASLPHLGGDPSRVRRRRTGSAGACAGNEAAVTLPGSSALDSAGVTARPPSLPAFIKLLSPEDRLVRGLERRIGAGSPLGDGERATVVFDLGPTAWTVLIEGSRMHLVPGRTSHYTTLVRADVATLAAMMDGEASGAEAFLDGRLVIRGNLALALKLDGADAPDRSRSFSRARTVRALDVDTF